MTRNPSALRLSAWLSATLLAASAAPVAAQAPASPPPAASGPAGATPETTAPKTTLLDRRRNDAAKLAGMVRFVDAACPQAEPDYDRFKRIVAALGVDLKALEEGELLNRSLNYAQAYRQGGAESCTRALALFGETGTAVPGLILPRPAKAP